MFQVSPKKYIKKFDYSYAPGVYTTLELLKYKKDKVLRVFISQKGKQNQGIDEIKRICRESNIEVVEAGNLIVKLSGSEDCYALGVFRKYESALIENQNHIVLVNPSDMGNVGTIIRTATAFGIKNIALIRPAVDIFDPKVIRSTTGSFFQSNVQYFDSMEEYFSRYKTSCYLFMLNESTTLNNIKFNKPFSLVFGNEGSGLPKEYKKFGIPVFIPQENTVDSLNLSIAAGIAIYNATQS